MATTLTRCEQAALDLAKYKGWLEQLFMGHIIEVSHADKTLRYSAGNIDGLQTLIRLKQAEVDCCNGRVRNRFIHNIPVDY